MTTCQVAWLQEYGHNSSTLMGIDSTWLKLKDLGREFSISSNVINKILQKQGWQDQNGNVTKSAFEAGAVKSKEQIKEASSEALWNTKICKKLLQKSINQPTNKSLQIQQWATLLEVLEEGSPSINATAEQMAKDLPLELVSDVNDQLAQRGCQFRVTEKFAA